MADNIETKNGSHEGVVLVLFAAVVGVIYWFFKNNQAAPAAVNLTPASGGTNTGAVLPNPIQVSSVLNPDGTVTTIYSDGSRVTTDPTGAVVSSTQATKIVASTVVKSNGTVITTYTDGTTATVNGSGVLLSTSTPPTKKNANPSTNILAPILVNTVTNADGSVTTFYDDGSTITIMPADIAPASTTASPVVTPVATSSTIDQLIPPVVTGSQINGPTSFSDKVTQGSGVITGTPGAAVSLIIQGNASSTGWSFTVTIGNVPYQVSPVTATSKVSFVIPASGSVSYSAIFSSTNLGDTGTISIVS